MPPKKQGGKDKKDAKADDRNYDLENHILQKKVEVLQQMLSFNQISTEESQGNITQLDNCLENTLKDIKSEEERRNEMIDDMNRQFEEMKSGFTERIANLDKNLAESKSARDDLAVERETSLSNFDVIVAAREQEVKLLGLKMDAMALEFADMVSDALKRLQERMELTHSLADVTKMPLLQRLENN